MTYRLKSKDGVEYTFDSSRWTLETEQPPPKRYRDVTAECEPYEYQDGEGHVMIGISHEPEQRDTSESQGHNVLVKGYGYRVRKVDTNFLACNDRTMAFIIEKEEA
jgi:hypothetical protein